MNKTAISDFISFLSHTNVPTEFKFSLKLNASLYKNRVIHGVCHLHRWKFPIKRKGNISNRHSG